MEAEKRIIFIRHGESASNAGQLTDDHTAVPLTELGWQQSRDVVKRLKDMNFIPDSIWISSYLRAQQSARPTLQSFPAVPTYDSCLLKEFDYLNFDGPTTTQLRAGKREWYWQQCDPFYQSSSKKESFHQFMTRAIEALEMLTESPHQKMIVFTHGHFMRMIQLLLTLDLTKDMDVKQIMTKFRDLDTSLIPNAFFWELSIQPHTDKVKSCICHFKAK